MGNRYIIPVKCPSCDTVDEDVYYAPTCGFVTHTCSKCGARIDLAEYTGISYEDASNADLIEGLIMSMEGVEMDRREAKEEIKKVLAENIVEKRVYQLRPWTCYTAKSVVEGQVYHLLGFTKVMHPDDWDPGEGVELAKRKALTFCAKKIMLWFSFRDGRPLAVCPWDTFIEWWLDGTLSRLPSSQQAYMEATAEMERRYDVVRFDTR